MDGNSSLDGESSAEEVIPASPDIFDDDSENEIIPATCPNDGPSIVVLTPTRVSRTNQYSGAMADSDDDSDVIAASDEEGRRPMFLPSRVNLQEDSDGYEKSTLNSASIELRPTSAQPNCNSQSQKNLEKTKTPLKAAELIGVEDYSENTKRRHSENANIQSTNATCYELSSSTPVMPRKPFTRIENLDITAMEKLDSNLNETVIDNDIIYKPLDELEHILENLSISKKKTPSEYMKRKSGRVPCSEDSDEGESFLSACSSPSIREPSRGSIKNQLQTSTFVVDANKSNIESHTGKSDIEVDTENLPVELDTENLPVELDTENLPVELDTENLPVELDTENLPVELDTENLPVELDTDKLAVELDTDKLAAELDTDELPVELDTEKLTVELDIDKLAIELHQLDKDNSAVDTIVLDTTEECVSGESEGSESQASSINSINFDSESSDCSIKEIRPGKPKKVTKKPTKKTNDQVPSSSREVAQPFVKDDFSSSVRKTIQELARIINEMPDPEDNHTVDRPKHLIVDLYKHQQYGVKWLHWRENQYPGGGILADEMGLGKTLMVIAMVSMSKSQKKSKIEKPVENSWVPENSKRRLVPSQSTLVVCPPGMLEQWRTEITNKTQRLTVSTFHGPQRHSHTSAAVLAQFDFVLTTYPTMSSEHKNLARSPLFRVHWDRIVLDEGHIVRNTKTIAAQAVSAIEANHRWIVTGTPVHNSADDMYATVNFLRLAPFNDKGVWKFWIGQKSMTSDQSARLHTIGKSLILRRTKDEVNAGDPTKEIPPKVVVDKIVELSEAERIIYDHLQEFAREKFKDFLKDKEHRENELQRVANNFVAGARQRNKMPADNNFTHMFALILRLRQASVLPYLIHTMLEDEDEENSSMDESIQEFELMNMRNPTFKKYFKSAKIAQLLHDIDSLRKDADEKGTKMEKVIVVSQWVTLLDIVYLHLTSAGYTVVSITGQQTLPERTEAMERLNNKKSRPQIMCLSLAAGGVGLNLVGANHVFFLDLHWNPQLELQAQDRVHRFGQTKPVTITRYISKDTMDERVAILQQQKLDLAEGILTNAKKRKGGGLSVEQMRTLFDM